MEIKEIDGKKYIEFDVDKHRKRKLMISVIFLILILVAIVTLINTTITLVKNKDIIQSDPLRYGMEVHGFSSCQCTDVEGRLWESEDTGFINRREGKGFINFTEAINLTKFKEDIDGTSRNS